MRKKKVVCLLLSCSVLFAMTAMFPFATSAQMVETETVSAKTVDPSLVAQFEKLLLESKGDIREKLLTKAAFAGITPDDLSNIVLSANDVALLNQKTFTKDQAKSNQRILMPSTTTVTSSNEPSLYSTNDMPDYALWPIIYKQQTSSWCRAGVIQTVLMYIKDSSPSQNTIINIDDCDASLSAMCTYVNDRLPIEEYVWYAYAKYGGDQETFNRWLSFDVNAYMPMMFAMKNATTSTTNWPYYTNGHYSICCGYLTWENNQYFIGDPYYFSDYVPSATANDGYHKKSWTKLNTVITNSHGQNNQHVVW